MIAIISFARKDSTRFPQKNMALLNGKPLIQYTIDTMKYIENILGYKGYILTDWLELQNYAENQGIEVIWRDHDPSWDDIRLNFYAHKHIRAQEYVLLQPTCPYRDNEKIVEWIEKCRELRIKSAYSASGDEKQFKVNGNFYYYRYSQLWEMEIVDKYSGIFVEENPLIDIDTIEDIKKAEKLCRQK